MLCDVSRCIASIQFGAMQLGCLGLAAIGFVRLRHEQCIKSKQAVGIGSSDMTMDCKPSSPCYHPRPTSESYTGV